MAKLEIRCFHFVCPDCGLSDAELGSLAAAGEIHCIVCLNEEERHVILRRWHAEDGLVEDGTPGERPTRQDVSPPSPTSR